MTQPPNSYFQVTFYVVSGQSLELASSTEPRRLNTGEIEATWTDNRHRRPHQAATWQQVSARRSEASDPRYPARPV